MADSHHGRTAAGPQGPAPAGLGRWPYAWAGFARRRYHYLEMNRTPHMFEWPSRFCVGAKRAEIVTECDTVVLVVTNMLADCS